MPKAPRDKASATPKKPTTKTKSKAGNGLPAEGNGGSAQPVAVSPKVASERSAASFPVEEQIRIRAYQLYLERGGHGGSPEQDWFRAQEEICGRGTAA